MQKQTTGGGYVRATGVMKSADGNADSKPAGKACRRGHPPHLDGKHACQFVTFRLADSLPSSKRQALEQDLAGYPVNERNAERYQRIERWLDAGLGCCALRHPAMAQTLQQALQHFDGDRYHLIAWCIMPNHVHVLLETLTPLPRIVHSWKRFTARWAGENAARMGFDIPANNVTNAGGGRFWMRDYWDRHIRDQKHYTTVLHYIHHNPVKAGLCQRPQDWLWSSADVGN